MIRRCLALVTSIASLAVAAPPLNDCTSAAWVNKATDFFSDLAGMQCQTLEVTQTQDVNVRVVQDSHHPEAQLAFFQPLISSTARKALDTYKAARPSLPLQNVTLIISPSSAGQTVAAASAGLNGECLVVVLTGSATAQSAARRELGVSFAVAHELVHCAQRWSVPQQMALPKEVRDWWAEGSADALATAVVESPEELTRAQAGFEQALDTPLTQQSYSASLFFLWYAKHKGSAGDVFHFMSQTPVSGTEAQQRAALVSIVGVDGLQQFAKDYATHAIPSLRGTPLPEPVLSQLTFSSTDTKQQPLTPFNVTAGRVVVQDGEYALSASSTATPPPVFKRGADAWGEPPARVGSMCAPGPVTFAGFATGGAASPSLTVTATKLEPTPEGTPCDVPQPQPACTPLGQRDPCLVGAWVLDPRSVEDRANAAIGKTNPPAVVNGDVRLVVLGGADGGAMIDFDVLEGGFDLYVGTTDPVSALYNIVITGKAQGGWSSENGVFRMCKQTDTVKLTSKVDVFLSGTPTSSEEVFEGAELQDTEYVCEGNRLRWKAAVSDPENGAPAEIVFKREGSCAAVPAPALLALGLALLRRRSRRH